MPLTNNEVTEIGKLLLFIPRSELLLLAKTTTKNVIQIENIDEAKKAIISFSQSPIELLKRRKLKRDYLLTYLFKNGHTNISSNTNKIDLVRQVLTLWNSEFTENDINMDEVDANVNNSFDNINNVQNVVIDNNELARITDNEIVNPLENSDYIGSRGEEDGFNIWSSWKQFSETEEELQFGAEFCGWYFDMVNKHGDNSDTSIDSTHFFPDCVLHLIHARDLPTMEQQIFRDVGAANVAARLDLILKQQLIRFNPNFTRKGMRCFADRFGRRMVVVCGSLHRGADQVGIFEQQFVIVRDISFGNNWKVKFMRLAASTQIDQPPMLEVTRKLLMQLPQ